ncbi:MAG: ABC transporter permease [bacterium]
MTIRDIFEETSIALLSNKVRSGLTVLGIVIGIASVIAMLAVGQGAQDSIQANISALGSNLIMIQPGAQGGNNRGQVSSGRGSSQTLTNADVQAIRDQMVLAQAVAPTVTSRQQVVASGSNTNTSIIGTTPDYVSVKSVEMEEGSFITDEQNTGMQKVAVLGPTTRDDLFGAGAEATGKTIRIKGMNFTVVGVTKSKGGTGFGSVDDQIIIPIISAQKFLTGNAYVSTINIQAIDSNSMNQLQADVTDLLLTRHKKTTDNMDFSVMNQADLVSTASTVTDTISYLLAAIAGISLLVGGIGIMNMMLTTVTERTREIGLRKAVGAKSHDINVQFLVEATMLTFVGGVMGVIVGYAIAYGITLTGLLTAKVTLTPVLLAFGISALIGITFGYYPASRAAKLNPIEALRYE